MLAILASILILLGILADTLHLLRHRRRGTPLRRATVVWLILTDLLPVAMLLIGWLSPDNGTALMRVEMWLLWAWIVTVVPRLAFYLFRLVGLRRTAWAVAAALALLFVWGATLGRTQLRVNRVEIASERVPRAFDGFRIVQISDLHVGSMVRPERELRRLADAVNALRPDAVFVTGDLVNIRADELDSTVMALLRRIEGPVWSVVGNHDTGTYIKDSIRHPAAENRREVIARQRAMGWVVLEDTTCFLRRGADSVSLSGVSFDPAMRKQRHDRHLPAPQLAKVYDGVPSEAFNITLVHVPQLWEAVLDAGYGDLTLSGHVHAMQMKIRPWGRGWSPAVWLYPRWSGRYDCDGRTLYINDGIGYVAYPMRLGAWPEITLFTLKRCA